MAADDPTTAAAEPADPADPADPALSIVEQAVLDVPDLATALGELRCLSGSLHRDLERRFDVGVVTGADYMVSALLSLVSRLADDSLKPVDGAMPITKCRCSTNQGVASALVKHLTSMQRVDAPTDHRSTDTLRPGTGGYL